MAIYKDGENWRAVYRYTDWTGERKQTQKRGFKTKREAQAWEREQLIKAKADIDMTFKSCFIFSRKLFSVFIPCKQNIIIVSSCFINCPVRA